MSKHKLITSYLGETELNIEEQKRHFANVAEAMHQLSIAIEPLFKAGPEVVAPGTDWWAIVAGDRHCSIAAARMYKDMSEQVDRENPNKKYFLESDMQGGQV